MTSTEPQVLSTKSNKLYIIFTTCICLVSLIISIYAIYTLISLQQNLQLQHQKLSNSLATITNIHENLTNQIQQLRSKVQVLQKNIINKKTDWNLYQARFYLQTADLKVMTDYDLDPAIVLYTQALELLKLDSSFSALKPYTLQQNILL